MTDNGALPFEDAERARELRDVGMRRTRAATPVEWKEQFHGEFDRLVWAGEPFTSEDVTRPIGLPHPIGSSHNNVIGALMNAAFRRHLKTATIERVGFRPGRRPSSHASALMVYRGYPIMEPIE